MNARQRVLTGLLLAVVLTGAVLPSVGARALPARLSDADFWRISQTMSEPDGAFPSDNFMSNEGRFQWVLPELARRVSPGGVYLGVGPEQNFTYIAATRPAMAFIIDIRRGNLHVQLLYKALFELSADRAEFLSLLFSRVRPEGVDRSPSVEALFDAFSTAPEADYQKNLERVIDLLTARRGFALRSDDRAGIDHVYRQFFANGPNLYYQRLDRNVGPRPTYAQLMSADDGRGRQWAYLATEENFQAVKELQARNLVVPVVGDLAGPKAVRAIGAYAREYGGVVSVFYLSNVEQYLRRDLKMGAFCGNVDALPLDPSSTFVRSIHVGGGGPRNLDAFRSELGAMQAETQACAGR